MEQLIERRRAKGADRCDEVWDAAHGVDEIVIADPRDRSLVWLRLDAGEYRPVERSSLLDVAVNDLVDQIDWPPTDDD